MPFEKPKNATGYHTDAKCCHVGAKRLDYAGLRFSLHHGRLKQPLRGSVYNAIPDHLLPQAATSLQNPLFHADNGFTLQAKRRTNSNIISMEVVIISKSKYEEMVGKLNRPVRPGE